MKLVARDAVVLLSFAGFNGAGLRRRPAEACPEIYRLADLSPALFFTPGTNFNNALSYGLILINLEARRRHLASLKNAGAKSSRAKSARMACFSALRTERLNLLAHWQKYNLGCLLSPSSAQQTGLWRLDCALSGRVSARRRGGIEE